MPVEEDLGRGSHGRVLRVVGDEALGHALIAAGATKLRHGHMYSYDFRRRPPPKTWEEPPGVRRTDIDRLRE